MPIILTKLINLATLQEFLNFRDSTKQSGHDAPQAVFVIPEYIQALINHRLLHKIRSVSWILQETIVVNYKHKQIAVSDSIKLIFCKASQNLKQTLHYINYFKQQCPINRNTQLQSQNRRNTHFLSLSGTHIKGT